MASWKHSGFHVHASYPFLPHSGDTLKNRLAYSFRQPACLSRIQYNEEDGSVTYETKKGVILNFTPQEFLAKLTLHIPDHYQNVRVYMGYYSSHIRRLLKKIKPPNTTSDSKPQPSKWAHLISRIFKHLPVMCPKCNALMELDGFVLEFDIILKHFPDISRAPPTKAFAKKRKESVYTDYDSSFDQSNSW